MDSFYNKNRECTPCNIEKSTRRYYENRNKISNRQKTYYEKNRDVLLEKCKTNQRNRKCHTQQINDLNGKVEELLRAVEFIFSKN